MNKNYKFLKKSNGITLISLVVTIIVLIILAGISINLILGENGIITKAQEAKRVQEIAEIKSEIQLELMAKEAEVLQNGNGLTTAQIEEILGKYGTVNKDGETIVSLTPTGKDYQIPFEEIYAGSLGSNIPVTPDTPDVPEGPTIAEIPEKSENLTAFDRTYGVIEIEFLKDTGYEVSTTPNEPNLGTNMKKVYWEEYEEEGTTKVREVLEGTEGFDNTKWYSYIAQTGATTEGGTSKWANAVTVDASGNITGYFVWIPRYAYRIVYFDTQAHEDAYRLTGATDGIIGYSDARGFVHPDGTTPSNMETPVVSITVGENQLRPHPAFENGTNSDYTQGEWNTALEGIWIAKYETSGSLTDMKVLPGESALVSQTIGDMYSNALNFSIANKSHMLKNSEWGAMAYLTDSKYGRNGTAVSKNEDTSKYTAGASQATVASNPLQSTTGNYYGIYDTVGGCYEFVAGYIADSSRNYGNSFASTNSEAEDAVNDKTTSTEYATVYNMLSADATRAENYTENINQKFGDGIIETSTAETGSTSWNSASSYFVGVYYGYHYPFFARGGNANLTSVGSFYFNSINGDYSSYSSFRLTLSVM